MELDNLKYIWKRAGQDPVMGHNEEKILEILKKKSQGPIGKMKRNLMFELVFAVLLYLPVCSYFLLGSEGELAEPAWLLIFIMGIFLVYFYFKNKLLGSMQDVSGPVKVNLERQLGTLEKYIRFYIIARILIPVSAVFLGAVMYLKLPVPAGSTLFYPAPDHPVWQVVLLWIGILGGLSLLIYFADRWYTNKSYGRHIRNLKELLAEMNEA